MAVGLVRRSRGLLAWGAAALDGERKVEHRWPCIAVGLGLLVSVPALSAVLYPKQTPWWDPAGIVVGALLFATGLVLFIVPPLRARRRRKRTGERQGIVRVTENSKVTIWTDGRQDAEVTPKPAMVEVTASPPGISTTPAMRPPSRRDLLRTALNLAARRGQAISLLGPEMGMEEDAQAWAKETFNLLNDALGPAEATLFRFAWNPTPGSADAPVHYGHMLRLNHLNSIIDRINTLVIREGWQP